MSEAIKLVSLLCFNPTLGGELTEGKKILYFYPRLPANVQKQYVGISEGMIHFVSDFSADEPLRITRTQKHRYAFHMCEKDFWLVLIVSNPVRLSKDRKSILEIQDDSVDESVLQFVLSRCYNLFKLFNGPMHEIVESFADPDDGMEMVRRRLDLFMRFFIPTIPVHLTPTCLDINGFKFLPANKPSFLTIQYLVNLVTSTFADVHSVSVMYQDKLVWSGLSQHDMMLLYKFHNELRSFFTFCALNERLSLKSSPGSAVASLAEELQLASESDSPPRARSSLSPLAPGFLTGPQLQVLRNDGSTARPAFVSANAPRIWLTDDGSSLAGMGASVSNPANRGPLRLVVYEKHSITLFIVVRSQATPQGGEEEKSAEPEAQEAQEAQESQAEAAAEASQEPPQEPTELQLPPELFYSQLEAFMAKNLFKLARMLQEHVAHVPEGHDNFSVLYFNHMNLAFKPSLKLQTSKLLDTIKVIRMMHEDFGSAEAPTEVYLKMRQDSWVVGRRANECRREFFVIVDDKGTLGEVQMEVERLEKTLFSKIFIH